MIHENDDQRYLPSSAPCPTDHTPRSPLPVRAPFEQLSAALDWVEVLQDDVATLHAHLHHLKAALEEVMP